MRSEVDEASERIDAGDAAGLRELLARSPDLVTARPSRHPSLLQQVAVDGGLGRVPNQRELARVLVQAGAPLEAPFVAAASVGNVSLGELLLEAGAAPGGTGPWSPLEEALYWRHPGFQQLLLGAGVCPRKLRECAGLGDLEALAGCFEGDQGLRPGQRVEAWPFGPLPAARRSEDPEVVLGDALVYACVNGRRQAAAFLLERGAPLDRPQRAFHYQGAPIHAAIWKGGLEMVRFLVERGADLGVRDLEYGGTPLGWARHEQEPEIAALLEAAGATAEPAGDEGA